MKGKRIYGNDNFIFEPPNIIIDDLYASYKVAYLLKDKIRINISNLRKYILEVLSDNNIWKSDSKTFENKIDSISKSLVFYQIQNDKIYSYDYSRSYKTLKSMLLSISEIHIKI